MLTREAAAPSRAGASSFLPPAFPAAQPPDSCAEETTGQERLLGTITLHPKITQRIK